jgi:hypothetical protein
MTTTYTNNEVKALKAIYAECLAGMGGGCWEDLENDPYTWAYLDTLTKQGWTKHEAAGTFAALMVKGAITEMDRKEYCLELLPDVRKAVEA